MDLIGSILCNDLIEPSIPEHLRPDKIRESKDSEGWDMIEGGTDKRIWRRSAYLTVCFHTVEVISSLLNVSFKLG